jgi:hypothetical protein
MDIIKKQKEREIYKKKEKFWTIVSFVADVIITIVLSASLATISFISGFKLCLVLQKNGFFEKMKKEIENAVENN